MKNKLDKNSLLYGIGGGLLGSTLVAMIVFLSLEGAAVTNMVTLIGGLGGGIISGTLTLFGVKRTIDLQREKERLDSMPQRIKGLMEIQEILQKWNLDTKIKFIKDIKKIDISKGSARLSVISKIKESLPILKESLYPKYLEVDGIVYTEIKGFLKHLETWVEETNDFEEKIVEEEEQEDSSMDIKNFYGSKVSDLENNYDMLTTSMDNLIKEYENLLFKYYK
ncbi:hypothetical protein ACFVV6_23005 [Bacillus mycoides]|uniref:hypothetical protein n=1 Tax=Bacillus mycoides TaxID=1405 RepID=UPI0018CD9602|nr:hypothetical protein [Bacillus mycoides]